MLICISCSMIKTEVVNNFFALVFIKKVSHAFLPRDKDQERESYQ